MNLREHAVSQLIEALCYKTEGRRFDSRWCQRIFSFCRSHYGPVVDSATNRNKYQEYFRGGGGGKGGRGVGLTTLPHLCADCVEIWEPQPPGALRAFIGFALPLILESTRRHVPGDVYSPAPLWEPSILHTFSLCGTNSTSVVGKCIWRLASPHRRLQHKTCRPVCVTSNARNGVKFRLNKLKWVYIQLLECINTKIHRRIKRTVLNGCREHCRLQLHLLVQTLFRPGWRSEVIFAYPDVVRKPLR
jgi:hypothetical protein